MPFWSSLPKIRSADSNHIVDEPWNFALYWRLRVIIRLRFEFFAAYATAQYLTVYGGNDLWEINRGNDGCIRRLLMHQDDAWPEKWNISCIFRGWITIIYIVTVEIVQFQVLLMW